MLSWAKVLVLALLWMLRLAHGLASRLGLAMSCELRSLVVCLSAGVRQVPQVQKCELESLQA